ncbi:MAG TPA: hypothetical protein G4N96_09570 [Chloroflexi bacterium]|nr:hypothetical protein [Chloroflexota bacterium]
MLAQQDLVQVRDYVVKILPQLLREDPEVGVVIEGILAEQFPRRDEFARMLDKLDRLHNDTKEEFGEVRQQFKQVDQRFEQVDQRFEQVDQRFEQVDQRFDGIDKTLLGLKRDNFKLKAGQENLMKRMDGQEAWLNVAIGNLRNDKGATAEDMFAEGFRYGLQKPDIKAEHIRLRQKLVDSEGLVFKAGFETEVDLIAQNNSLIVFEVKSNAKPGEVGFFALKVELITHQNPDKKIRAVFVALGARETVRQRCLKDGIELLG